MPNSKMTDHNGFAIDDVPPSLARPHIVMRNNVSPHAVTADKDPNFFNRLEARPVAPCDTLDHVVRVSAVVQTPCPTASIIDPVTGKDIAEQNTFVHPIPIEKEPGFCVQAPKIRKKPEKQIFTNRKGKTFESETPYHYDPVTGQREYRDLRPRGIRIASDAQRNPLTFATKPGEIRAPRGARAALADMLDYDDDDPAAAIEQDILRRRK